MTPKKNAPLAQHIAERLGLFRQDLSYLFSEAQPQRNSEERLQR